MTICLVWLQKRRSQTLFLSYFVCYKSYISILSNNGTGCQDWNRWNFSKDENWMFSATSALSTGSSLMTPLQWSRDWRSVKYLERRLKAKPVTYWSSQGLRFLVCNISVGRQGNAMHCILLACLQYNISFPGLICLLIWRATPLYY